MRSFFTFLMIFFFFSSIGFSNGISKEDYKNIKKKYRSKDISYSKEFNSFVVKKRQLIGLVDSKANGYKLLIPIEYDSIVREHTNYRNIKVWKDLKVGIYSSEYVQLLEPLYHNMRINKFNDGLVEYSYLNKRGIYDLRFEKVLVEPKYEDLSFLNYGYSAGLVVVGLNGKYGLLDVYQNKLVFEIEYDKVSFVKEFSQDIEGKYYESHIELLKGKKKLYYSSQNTREQIYLDGYSRLNMGRLRYLKADTLFVNKMSSSGEFMARNEESQKWGLYQNYDDVFEVLVPAEFDQVEFFEWGAPLVIVHKNGLKGFFLKEWGGKIEKYSENCIFDDLVLKDDAQGRKYLAARINDDWFWVDWSTGKVNRSNPYISLERMRMTSDDLPMFYRK